MSTPGLFIAGFVVSLILAAALALLVYAAIEDGRDAAARERERAMSDVDDGRRSRVTAHVA